MKAGPPHDPSQEMDENDPVWRLLERAPMRQPDAWFASRTLAHCREEMASARLSLSHIYRWAWGGGLSFCLALILMFAQVHFQADRQKDVQDAFQFMATFDADSDSGPSWQDSNP